MMLTAIWFAPEYTWYVRLAIGFWFWLVLGVARGNNWENDYELYELRRVVKEVLREE